MKYFLPGAEAGHRPRHHPVRHREVLRHPGHPQHRRGGRQAQADRLLPDGEGHLRHREHHRLHLRQAGLDPGIKEKIFARKKKYFSLILPHSAQISAVFTVTSY